MIVLCVSIHELCGQLKNNGLFYIILKILLLDLNVWVFFDNFTVMKNKIWL